MAEQPKVGLPLATILASSIHDMKNSLSLVLQTIELLEDSLEAPVEQRRDYHQRLHHEAFRLKAQMLQMLTLYRLDHGVYSPNIAEHVVADVLEECALEHAPILGARGIAIDWDCDPDLIGFFDGELIVGVLANALNNAQRFARTKVRLSAGRSQGLAGITLKVEDDGAGFSDQKLAALRCGAFLPGTEAGDSGLGLLFSAAVLAIHVNRGESGHLRCSNDSQLGGALVEIYLP